MSFNARKLKRAKLKSEYKKFQKFYSEIRRDQSHLDEDEKKEAKSRGSHILGKRIGFKDWVRYVANRVPAENVEEVSEAFEESGWDDE